MRWNVCLKGILSNAGDILGKTSGFGTMRRDFSLWASSPTLRPGSPTGWKRAWSRGVGGNLKSAALEYAMHSTPME